MATQAMAAIGAWHSKESCDPHGPATSQMWRAMGLGGGPIQPGRTAYSSDGPEGKLEVIRKASVGVNIAYQTPYGKQKMNFYRTKVWGAKFAKEDPHRHARTRTILEGLLLRISITSRIDERALSPEHQ